MATSTPALVVPRARRRTEQLIRANALTRAGAIDSIRLEDLTTDDLGQWLASAVTQRVSRDNIRLDGLAEVPKLAAALLRRREQDNAQELAHVC